MFATKRNVANSPPCQRTVRTLPANGEWGLWNGEVETRSVTPEPGETRTPIGVAAKRLRDAPPLADRVRH